MPTKTPRQSGASLASPGTPLITYSHGDIVLAKVKGHPAWPARIVDPLTSPLNLRDERKIAQKNSYLVKFFKTADYAWMNAKEMSTLKPPEIRAFIDNPNKKGAELKAAYQIALAPEAWEAELDAYQQEFEEQQKALEIDELEVEPEGDDKATAAKPKQKRKRPSETKTPTASAKKRKSISNGPIKASATPEPVAAPAIKKRVKKKEEPAVVVDGETIVREWRHRLQRVFLGKTPVTEKIMPEIDSVFSDIEKFEMKTEWLTSSKLAKVLKRVGVLEDSKVPLDSKYNIRARARALQEKWRKALLLGDDSSNRPRTNEAADQPEADSASNATNGKKSSAASSPKKAKPTRTNGTDAADNPPKSNDAPVKEDSSKEAPAIPDADENKMVVEPTDAGAQTDTLPESIPEATPAAESKSSQVNGDNPATQEKTGQDVDMADSNGVAPAEVDKKPTEDDDDGEQMDCADSPEPVTVESNDADKDKVMSEK